MDTLTTVIRLLELVEAEVEDPMKEIVTVVLDILKTVDRNTPPLPPT